MSINTATGSHGFIRFDDFGRVLHVGACPGCDDPACRGYADVVQVDMPDLWRYLPSGDFAHLDILEIAYYTPDGQRFPSSAEFRSGELRTPYTGE